MLRPFHYGARPSRCGQAVSILAAKARDHFHTRRAERFVRLLRPQAGMRLLDLGGSDGSFAERVCRHVRLDVTVADISADNRAAALEKGFDHVLLDETSQILPFGDGEFDIILCNSVIEHATNLPAAPSIISDAEWYAHARAAQTRFAAEIQRIGRGYFVQTPHKHFPIEHHMHLPFVQYLGHARLSRLVVFTDRYWIKYCGGVDFELFTPSDLKKMFPDSVIEVERAWRIPKSIIAWRAP
jgi:hypothetical protein